MTIAARYKVGVAMLTVERVGAAWMVVDKDSRIAVSYSRNVAIDDVTEQRARAVLQQRLASATTSLNVAADICRSTSAVTVAPLLSTAAEILDGIADPKVAREVRRLREACGAVIAKQREAIAVAAEVLRVVAYDVSTLDVATPAAA